MLLLFDCAYCTMHFFVSNPFQVIPGLDDSILVGR